MRRFLPLALAALTACQAPGVSPDKPAKPRATPGVKASATPAATPKPAATSTPAPLPRAPGPYIRLTGAVRLDAGYTVAAGLAEAAGDHVRVPAGGTLLSDVGAGVLGTGLAALITDNGAGLISDQAGSLITDNGGGLVARDGAMPRFRLAQAPPTPGALAPVERAAVIPVDMRTGRPLGTVALTDAAGAFTVEVPAALAGNVLLAVRLPAKDRTAPAFTDPAARPNLIAPVVGQAARLVDEDTAIATRYLQACFVTRFVSVLGAGSADGVVAQLAGATKIVPAVKALLTDLIAEFRAAAKATGVDQASPARREALARQVAHGLLANVDLAAVMTDAAYAPGYTGPQEPALAAMTDILRRMREAASTKLAADPQAFAAKPYLAGTNTSVRRGADLPDFCVRAYLIPEDPQGLIKTGQVMADLGIREAGGADQEDRLRAAMYSLVGAMAQALVADERAKADALAIVRTPMQ